MAQTGMAIRANEQNAAVVLHTCPALPIDDAQFFALCQQNRDYQFEQTAEGDLLIMPPAGGETGHRNLKIARQLDVWAEKEGAGVGFDSSTGYVLPSGAKRSPDASWITRSRLAALTAEQKRVFLPLCPDFVIELRSPSDSLDVIKAKMTEYRDNGARLGWLIDPTERRVYVYRLNVPAEVLENPDAVSGDPELPGFILDLTLIWTPSF